jgi:hypothetical protein
LIDDQIKPKQSKIDTVDAEIWQCKVSHSRFFAAKMSPAPPEGPKRRKNLTASKRDHALALLYAAANKLRRPRGEIEKVAGAMGCSNLIYVDC